MPGLQLHDSPPVDLMRRQPQAAAAGRGERRAQGQPLTGAHAQARDVVCILGLPFDAITLQEAVQRVRGAISARRPLFLSTPNLNFLIGCQNDAAFRASIIASDLSVADGMPLVWMSRLLGTPLPERVTGSGLFERLRNDPLPPGCTPIRVYYFGGPPGAAEAASRRLQAESSAMVCVGCESPGFGSVESMSDLATMDRINASGADFLVVALGAAKGQAWIQRNRERLKVPVISHLGAVVNFEAGTVSRAPAWVQRSGLEWLWRIKEEPALWKRYVRDAAALLGLLAGKVLPHMLWLRLHRPANGIAPDPEAIRAAFYASSDMAGPVCLNLSQVDAFGPTYAGQLLRLQQVLAAADLPLRLVGLSARTRQLVQWNGLGSLIEQNESTPARPA